MGNSNPQLVQTKINFWPSVVDGLTSVLAIIVLFTFLQSLYAAERNRDQENAINLWANKYGACAQQQARCSDRTDEIRQQLLDKQREVEAKLNLVFVEAGRGDVITFEEGFDMLRVRFKSSVLFPTNKWGLLPEGKAVVRLCAKALVEANNYDRIQVEGFTDDQSFPAGRSEFPANNWELSAARALTVVRELSTTIPDNRLSANGYGEQHPIASNDTEEGRSMNRRIELRIIFSKPGMVTGE